jgi:hypothetical protein
MNLRQVLIKKNNMCSVCERQLNGSKHTYVPYYIKQLKHFDPELIMESRCSCGFVEEKMIYIEYYYLLKSMRRIIEKAPGACVNTFGEIMLNNINGWMLIFLLLIRII